MDKPSPKKCNACKTTYKRNFAQHAQACPAGFTEWTHAKSLSGVMPQKEIAAFCIEALFKKRAEPLDKLPDEITIRERAW